MKARFQREPESQIDKHTHIHPPPPPNNWGAHGGDLFDDCIHAQC